MQVFSWQFVHLPQVHIPAFRWGPRDVNPLKPLPDQILSPFLRNLQIQAVWLLLVQQKGKLMVFIFSFSN